MKGYDPNVAAMRMQGQRVLYEDFQVIRDPNTIPNSEFDNENIVFRT